STPSTAKSNHPTPCPPPVLGGGTHVRQVWHSVRVPCSSKVLREHPKYHDEPPLPLRERVPSGQVGVGSVRTISCWRIVSTQPSASSAAQTGLSAGSFVRRSGRPGWRRASAPTRVVAPSASGAAMSAIVTALSVAR